MKFYGRTLTLIAAAALLTGCVVISTGGAPARNVPAPSTSQLIGHEDINAFRASQGRGPVVESTGTARAARRHAVDMASKGFFSHTGSDGRSSADRLRAAGCTGYLAENIAKGQKTRAAVMKAWINSPGHRKNMLLPQVNFYSVERVQDVWVMTLASDC